MNRHTLNGQFLERLTDEQKGLLWQYYRLLKTPIPSIDDEFDQVTQIWNQAETDHVLCKWLELIDYFMTEPEAIDENVENDKRAYYCEHLETLLGERFNTDYMELEWSSSKDEANLFILECPDQSGCILVATEGHPATSLEKLNQTVCNQCKHTFAHHKRVTIENFASNPS